MSLGEIMLINVAYVVSRLIINIGLWKSMFSFAMSEPFTYIERK